MDYIIIAIFSSLVGSYLGSLSYRIPRKYIEQWYDEEDLGELGVNLQADPTVVESKWSLCPQCKQRLKWFHLIPVLSWTLLGGRCAYCKSRISPRYIIIELLTILSALLSYYILGFSVGFFLLFIILSGMILASSIDIECFILPDFITLPLLGFGSVYTLILFLKAGYLEAPFSQNWINSFFGGVLLPLFLIIFSWLFTKIRGKEGFGMGDIKLLSGLGFWFGFQAVLIALTVGSVAAILNALILSAARGRQILSSYFPFGPFIVLGFVIYLIFFQHFYP